MHWAALVASGLVVVFAILVSLAHTTAACAEPAQPGGEGAGFIVFGDFGGGDMQAEVADAMRGWADRGNRVDALATTGDNVHPCGLPSLYDEQLGEPYAALGVPDDVALFVTLGNHDVEAGKGAEQLDYLGLPDLPYARELDGVQLIFLDSNRVDDADQTEWLDATLSAPGPDLRAVFMHHPAYSCGFNGSTRGVIDDWVPLFERHGVAVVFSGHNQNYERITSAGGVTYVVTGGGGMFTTPVEPGCLADVPGIQERAAAETHHFVGARVDGSSLYLEAVDSDGTVFDSVSIGR